MISYGDTHLVAVRSNQIFIMIASCSAIESVFCTRTDIILGGWGGGAEGARTLSFFFSNIILLHGLYYEADTYISS